MSERDLSFDYVAVDPAGKRVRGRILAADERGAFAKLKLQGLAPIGLVRGRGASMRSGRTTLADKELEAMLGDLAALLRAGSDIRSALSILGRRSGKGGLQAACEVLAVSIGGGEGAEAAFTRLLSGRHDVIPALLAAGEAGGDLASGLERAAQILASRRVMREQLISALSYPAFILLSTVGAIALILFTVIPSLAPLVDDAGPKAAPILATMVAVSNVLRAHLTAIGLCIAAALGTLLVVARAGMLTRPLQGFALDGPARSISSSLIFGAFAQSLGAMLTAGAPMGDALRLAIRTAPWAEARERLGPVLASVRQGESLSLALSGVEGFPSAIARLAAVGEATGALGPMLVRSGGFEEAAALKQIESLSKLLGPILIVTLGLIIGLLMGAMLSGVTGLGEAALTD